MAVAPSLKLFFMAESSLASRPTHFASKTSSHRHIPLRPNPIGSLRLCCYRSSLSFLFLKTKKKPSAISLVAQTSDWARQDEEELEFEGEEFLQESEEEESGLLEWEGEDQAKEEGVGEVISEGDSSEIEGFVDAFPEPPEEAKLFVGNLPYDVDSEKLAHLFQEAGIVEIAEVIYNRETDQSRGFGFVTMRSVEEAEKAVEMFSRYDCNGRLLTVNKAAPRGSPPDRPQDLEPSLKIYVGNLPWQVDDTRLEQIFSGHGKVVSASVVYDRETGRSRGFGFVTMASKRELDDAIAALDGQSLDGRTIRVNVAEERPRRRSF